MTIKVKDEGTIHAEELLGRVRRMMEMDRANLLEDARNLREAVDRLREAVATIQNYAPDDPFCAVMSLKNTITYWNQKRDRLSGQIHQCTRAMEVIDETLVLDYVWPLEPSIEEVYE